MENNMVTEDYVSFETAKLLKEKGFDEFTPISYRLIDGYSVQIPCRNGFDEGLVSKITLQMAMKWLREEKYIPIEILWHYDSNSDVEEWYFVHHAELRILPNDIEYYESYEQACEAAIKYCLENLI